MISTVIRIIHVTVSFCFVESLPLGAKWQFRAIFQFLISNIKRTNTVILELETLAWQEGFSYTPHEPNYYMTQYVATRWYSAPEILLSMLEYGTAVNMWSVDCIFVEMIVRSENICFRVIKTMSMFS